MQENYCNLTQYSQSSLETDLTPDPDWTDPGRTWVPGPTVPAYVWAVCSIILKCLSNPFARGSPVSDTLMFHARPFEIYHQLVVSSEHGSSTDVTSSQLAIFPSLPSSILVVAVAILLGCFFTLSLLHLWRAVLDELALVVDSCPFWLSVRYVHHALAVEHVATSQVSEVSLIWPRGRSAPL